MNTAFILKLLTCFLVGITCWTSWKWEMAYEKKRDDCEPFRYVKQDCEYTCIK